jgi:hypothetical protein
MSNIMVNANKSKVIFYAGADSGQIWFDCYLEGHHVDSYVTVDR